MKRTAILRQHGIGLAVAAAMMEGMQHVLPDNRPRLPTPPSIAGMTSRQKEKMRRAGNNDGNRLANRAEWRRRQNLRSREEVRFHALVNKMSNYARNQWNKAGSPGFQNKDVAALMPYAGTAARKLDGTYLVLGGQT